MVNQNAYALGKVLRHIIYRHNHRNGLIHAFSSSRWNLDRSHHRGLQG